MTPILPDEIPSDAAPLDGTHLVPDAVLAYKGKDALVDGKNMFVTLLDGRFFTGLCLVDDVNETFTIGNSDEIPFIAIETAREV